jgi:predicted acylesterase/phospholipase RssA
MVEHVMASASVPLLFDFQRVPKKYDYVKAERGEEQDSAPESSRPFWDGALLSNTPTRELINQHKLFWEKHTTPLTADHKTVYEMRTKQDKQKREKYAGQLFEILWNEMTRTTPPELQQLKAPAIKFNWNEFSAPAPRPLFFCKIVSLYASVRLIIFIPCC